MYHHFFVSYNIFCPAFMSIVAMFTKMSRIFILVKSGLHRRKVTAAQIVSVTGLIYVFWFFYLLLYTFISPHTVKCTRSYSMTGQLTVTEFCHESVTGFNVTLLAIEGAVLIISAALCYGTRDVPDAINEASVISLGEKLNYNHYGCSERVLLKNISSSSLIQLVSNLHP